MVNARRGRVWWIVSTVAAFAVAIVVGFMAVPASIPSNRVAVSSRGGTETTPPPTSTVTPTTSQPLAVQRYATWIPPTTAAPTPVPLSGATVPVISRISTNDPVVFFTIDDGFVRDPAVVTFLRDHQIPVTLFVLPGPVHQAPGYFQSIHALGASIQDHTTDHPNLLTLDAAAQQREICGPLDDYASLFGQRPWLFRPPYGNYNATTVSATRACGLRAVVLWRATMNNGVLTTQGGPLQPGDIILMHFRTDLLTNLQVALNAATARGLHPAPLEAYLPPG